MGTAEPFTASPSTPAPSPAPAKPIASPPANHDVAHPNDATDPTAAFKALFPSLVDQLLHDVSTNYDLPPSALADLRRTLHYNVPHGKLNRGLAVQHCFRAFRAHTVPISADDRRDADVLGWCVELLQAFFLVADDIMDDSVTRRGQPCFFRLPGVGLKAVNDALLLELMIFRLLRLYFRARPVYMDLVELFQDITYTTELGQLLDLTSQDQGPVQLEKFSEDVLARIYKYKTSHYTFYLPVALGMRLAGVEERGCYETAKRICLEMGYYFQAQDDFLDAFGDPQVTGKVGTDIEENTCTWLVVQALKVVDAEQRKVLEENYGRKEVECAARVKALYVQLGLKDKFAAFEQESYERMRALIDKVEDMPVEAFEFLLAKIYKREK